MSLPSSDPRLSMRSCWSWPEDVGSSPRERRETSWVSTERPSCGGGTRVDCVRLLSRWAGMPDGTWTICGGRSTRNWPETTKPPTLKSGVTVWTLYLVVRGDFAPYCDGGYTLSSTTTGKIVPLHFRGIGSPPRPRRTYCRTTVYSGPQTCFDEQFAPLGFVSAFVSFTPGMPHLNASPPGRLNPLRDKDLTPIHEGFHLIPKPTFIGFSCVQSELSIFSELIYRGRHRIQFSSGIVTWDVNSLCRWEMSHIMPKSFRQDVEKFRNLHAGSRAADRRTSAAGISIDHAIPSTRGVVLLSNKRATFTTASYT